MNELVLIIKEQTEMLLRNMYEQVNHADLNCMTEDVNNSRFLFHMIHSMDRYFINPFDYDYSPVYELIGVNEDYSIISESREGYIGNDGYVVPREKLLAYIDYVRDKVNAYLDGLTDEDLKEKPKDCPYTRMELILAQNRHAMFHCGMSELVTFEAAGEWLEYTGIKYVGR